MELFQVFICTKCVLLCCGLFLYVQTIKRIHCFMTVNDTFVVAASDFLTHEDVFPIKPHVMRLHKSNVTFSHFCLTFCRMWSLFPWRVPVEKSAPLACSSTIHMKWQDYTRSLEHAVVITFKWAHATVPFTSDALEKLSTQIQSPHLEPHCPLGAELHFLLLFINTHLKPKHERINSAASAKSLTRAKPRSTLLMLFVLPGSVV